MVESARSEFFQHTLGNGLKVVVERMPAVRSAAAGFLARTGARDETRDLAGVSHFLEHMCFKGTPTRTWADINQALDQIAVEYNAFTGEERTFYYGWTRAADIDQQIELLADMMRSQLPEAELDMERKVVLDEIALYEDQLSHVAYDFLLSHVFSGHSFEWPVLGYRETVAAVTREQMLAYYRDRYAPNNLILAAAGQVDPDQIFALAERYCGDWPAAAERPPRQVPTTRTGVAVKQVERFTQQAICLAFAAPSSVDPLHETADALATILGGINSRFFWNIVQTGLSSDAACYRLPFCDCGLILLWGQTDPENSEQLLEAMRAQAKQISTQLVEPSEVQRIVNRRRTALALEVEAPYYRLVQVVDDVDLRGQPRTVEQRMAAVEAVNVDGIGEYLKKWPIDGPGYLVSIGPRNWPETDQQQQT